MAGKGLEADRPFTETGATTGVDPDTVDCWLAVLTGYVEAASRSQVPTSPHLRTHQAW